MSEGRRPDRDCIHYWYDGPVWTPEEGYTGPCIVHWYDGVFKTHLPGDGEVYFADAMPGDFVPLTEPVAAPEPDWSQAPKWATHHVFCGDAEGLWIKTDGTPTVDGWGWGFNAKHEWTDWLSSDLTLPLGVDWRTTLRKRPEVSGAQHSQD